MSKEGLTTAEIIEAVRGGKSIDHHTLLGIHSSEVNPEVVEQAFAKRATMVRSLLADGKSAELCERILRQLSVARLTLKSPINRAAYDARQKTTPPSKESCDDPLILRASTAALFNSQPVKNGPKTEGMLAPRQQLQQSSTPGTAWWMPPPNSTGNHGINGRYVKPIVFGVAGLLVVIIACFAYFLSGTSRSVPLASNPKKEKTTTPENSSLVAPKAKGNLTNVLPISSPPASNSKSPPESDPSALSPSVKPALSREENSSEPTKGSIVPANKSPPSVVRSSTPELARSHAVSLPPSIDLGSPGDPPQRIAVTAGGMDLMPVPEYKLGLDYSAADLGQQYVLYTKQKPNDPTIWQVYLELGQDTPAEKRSSLGRERLKLDSPCAEFQLTSRGLVFSWLEGPPLELSGQLRNCILIFELAGVKHFLRLRKPVEIASVVVLLEKSPQLVPIECPNLPRSDLIFMEIIDARDFPAGVERDIPGDRLKANQAGRLLPSGWDKTEIRVSIRKRQRDLAITMEPGFYLGKQRLEMTHGEITSASLRTQKTLADNTRKLAIFERRLQQIPSEAQTVANSDIPVAAKNALTGKLMNEQKAAQSGVARLSDVIPKNREAIARLTALADFAGRIHGKAQVRLRVFLSTKSGEIDLLLAGRPE